MKKILLLGILTFLGLAIAGCRSQKVDTIAAYHTYDVECLGVELDGSQTLRAYGNGRNKQDAIEQAKKNAVYTVIFKGVNQGINGCNTRPLINEANAAEKYEEYFNIFFADKGEYLKYVTSEDTKPGSNTKAKASDLVNFCITVRVLRSELRERLKNDNVIKN
jgi:hypothetical protein